MSLFFNDRKNIELKVGIFSLLTILVLIAGYSYLVDLYARQKYTEIKISFPNINNLEKGNNVTINGFKRGRVKDIAIIENGILVTALVDLEFPLKEGSVFVIKESDLMGNHQIDIIPGTGKTALDLAQIQPGLTRQGLTDLVARMNSMAENVERIFYKFEKADNLLENLNSFLLSGHKTLADINHIFANPQKDDIRSIIAHLNTTTRELSALIIDNREQIQSVILHSDNAFKKLDKTLTVVDSATVYLMEAGRKLNATDNNAGMLLNDKKLYNNLLRTTEKVDSILVDVKKNPRRYFRISVF